ncbi:hypothetical protein yc1106_05573 [Curvularia clavata]|uniref:Uncharacterized protein n=1 Tax=Curvularia clavata TaxID=95742 RepID=A0A9Q8Z939_CURCL|nr:hypothetical protein yc1106_05573 [Curvularia clavata]
MPPANSPDSEPTFISALRELASPVNDDVLNLAATLSTQPEEGEEEEGIADDVNNDDYDDLERAHLHYLRVAHEHDQVRLERSRERLRLLERQRDELEQRDRLRRVMSRLSRLSDNNYGDRVPSQNSLYDWSPANDPPAATESSLRSTAILQSAGVRRHPRFSARTREAASSEAPSRHASHRSLREMLAARASLHNDSVERHREATSRHASMQRMSDARASPMLEQTVKYLSRIRHSSNVDESLEYARDAGFLSKDYFCLQHADFIADTFTIPRPMETSWLVSGAVLSGCQHATTVAPSVSVASRHSGLPPPIRPWIWTPTEASTTRTSQPSETHPQQDQWPVKVTIHDVDWDSMSLSATMEAYNVPSHPHSHSILPTNSSAPPVTRTSSITTYLEGEILDFNNHTLLTESFKSSAANDATYWRKLPPFQKMTDEEVIRALTSKKWFTEVLSQEWILMRWKERCFVKSLNRSTSDPVQPPPSTTTAPFYSDGPASTSVHMSQIQPSPYRIVRNAQTGRAEVEITPQPLFNSSSANDAEHATFDDSGCGLTISGFYYVALNRTSGKLEGLYYDPQSSPYQCLKLESVRGGLRSQYDYTTIHTLLDSCPILHVSFNDPSHPFPVVLPMLGCTGNFSSPSSPDRDVYIHGYVSGRLFKKASPQDDNPGLPVTIAASFLDGLVLSLTPFHNSCNYRSAVVYGYANVVEDEEEAMWAMKLITENMLPGRWEGSRVPPTQAEVKSTSVLKVKISSASAKIRAGGPSEDRADLKNKELVKKTWTGVVPYWGTWGEPVPGKENGREEVEEYIESWRVSENSKVKQEAFEAAEK